VLSLAPRGHLDLARFRHLRSAENTRSPDTVIPPDVNMSPDDTTVSMTKPSAFDAIASDNSEIFATPAISAMHEESTSDPSVETLTVRPDLEAIFDLHQKLKGSSLHGGADITDQHALPSLVDRICSMIGLIRANEATRRYMSEIRDEEAMQMMDVLQTVRHNHSITHA
jgi:hypothetical protein